MFGTTTDENHATAILVRTNVRATGPARQLVYYLGSVADIMIPIDGAPVVLEDAGDDPVVYTALAGHAGRSLHC